MDIGRDFRAKGVRPDEGILIAISRRDGRLAAENHPEIRRDYF